MGEGYAAIHGGGGDRAACSGGWGQSDDSVTTRSISFKYDDF
jgi:hypothetical protein